jgi:hypothetical protein
MNKHHSSNHIHFTMINITIIFNQLLRCRSVAKFLTIWERRRFELIATSWAKPLSHARTSLYITRVGYRSSYSKMSLDRTARPGGRLMPGSSGQACPRSKLGSSGHACPRSTSPLRFVSRLPAMRTTVQISPRTGYLASWSEQVIRPLCARHVQSQPRAKQRSGP